MKIAIDLNDVVRDFSRGFAKYYREYYDHTFEMDEQEFWTNDLRLMFPFKSDSAYEHFTYEKYAFEIFGRCDTCHFQTPAELNVWLNHTITDIDTDEPIEVIFVSPMEYGLSISATLFFLSKLGAPVREYYFPTDSLTIWDKCDILITANPRLLENAPSDKVSVKIETDYNKENVADFTFGTFREFLKKEKNVEKLIQKRNEKRGED